MLDLQSIEKEITVKDSTFIFQTSKGSIYFGNEKGETQRYKTPHMGHDKSDVGIQMASEFTIYLDSRVAQIVSEHIYKEIPSYILIKEDALFVFVIIDKTIQKVVDERLPYHKQPALGLHPYEIHRSEKNAHGFIPTFHHLGNEITLYEHE